MNNKIRNFKKQVLALKKVQIIGPMKLETPVSKALPTIFVDGGIVHNNDHRSSISIGDNDSAAMKLDIIHNKDKDDSDLKLALNLIDLSVNYCKIDGFLGGSKAHELINFGEIYHFSKKLGSSGRIGKNIFISKSGCREYKFNGYFSIIVLEDTILTIEGEVKYKLIDVQCSMLTSRLLHNYANSSFKIKSNNPYYLIRE